MAAWSLGTGQVTACWAQAGVHKMEYLQRAEENTGHTFPNKSLCRLKTNAYTASTNGDN